MVYTYGSIYLEFINGKLCIRCPDNLKWTQLKLGHTEHGAIPVGLYAPCHSRLWQLPPQHKHRHSAMNVVVVVVVGVVTPVATSVHARARAAPQLRGAPLRDDKLVR